MREILFRGKRINNGGWYDGGCAGDWVYGGYAFDGTNSYIISYGVVIHECMGDAPDIYNDFSYIKVDPSTVGQYTGLTDKNGKKVFEGDILSVLLDFEHGRTIKGIVEYKIDCFRIKYNNPNGVGALTLNPISYERNHIIIGNIHDNPELLEVGE